MVNYEKLNIGRSFSEADGDMNNHGDCYNYGSVGGCDEECPALNNGECEIYKDVDDYITKETNHE
jgi:hypothetical protein